MRTLVSRNSLGIDVAEEDARFRPETVPADPFSRLLDA